LRNVLLIAVFGLILFSAVPTLLDSTTTNIRLAVAQPEDPFPPMPASNLTEEQRSAREQLLQQEGFSVNAIARNLSAPLNILYGPDNTLWITERVGKDIVRIDPTNGTKLNAMPIPNANQSKGQDGVLGMAFDPDFNNTHHIYVAYTYEGDSGAQISCPQSKLFTL
jgi:glucose/arabinose dehydrogenase